MARGNIGRMGVAVLGLPVPLRRWRGGRAARPDKRGGGGGGRASFRRGGDVYAAGAGDRARCHRRPRGGIRAAWLLAPRRARGSCEAVGAALQSGNAPRRAFRWRGGGSRRSGDWRGATPAGRTLGSTRAAGAGRPPRRCVGRGARRGRLERGVGRRESPPLHRAQSQLGCGKIRRLRRVAGRSDVRRRHGRLSGCGDGAGDAGGGARWGDAGWQSCLPGLGQ